MCAIEDCEPWKVCRQENRRARKQHRCTECGRTIQTGERYSCITGLAEDHWQRFRICNHCLAAGRWLDIMCSGWPLTMLCDELREHSEEFQSDLLGDLYQSVRNGWQDGQAPIPDVEVIETDARSCLNGLVAP